MSTPQSDFSQLNRCRRTNLIGEQWVQIWKKVWGSFTFHWDWVVIWQVLCHGFFHNRRTHIWGLNDGLCLRCHTQMETIENLFFECRSMWRRWACVLVMGSRLAPTFMKGSLEEMLYAGITRAQQSPVILVIIVEMLGRIWRERNALGYHGERVRIPIQRLLTATKAHSRALQETSESERKCRRWEEEIAILHEATNPPQLQYRHHV